MKMNFNGTIKSFVNGMKIGVWPGVIASVIAFVAAGIATSLGLMSWSLLGFTGIAALTFGLTTVAQFALGSAVLGIVQSVTKFDIKHIHPKIAASGALGFIGLGFALGAPITIEGVMLAVIVSAAMAVIAVYADAQMRTKFIVGK